MWQQLEDPSMRTSGARPHLEAALVDVAAGLQRVRERDVLRGLAERVHDVGRLCLLRPLPRSVLRDQIPNPKRP